MPPDEDLLDLFAALVLPAIIAQHAPGCALPESEALARKAYEIAEAMMAERTRRAALAAPPRRTAAEAMAAQP